jgi:cytochrome c553
VRCGGAGGHGAALLFAVVLSSAISITAQELPVGPGREAVATRCLSCHESDIIAQQRLTRAAWSRSVDKMIRWGAVVGVDEREPMLDYLAAHFAQKPVSSHIVATSGSEAVYKRACLTCHEDDIIESQRLARPGWVRSVDKMIRWGADVPAAEKDALVDYLAARYPPR